MGLSLSIQYLHSLELELLNRSVNFYSNKSFNYYFEKNKLSYSKLKNDFPNSIKSENNLAEQISKIVASYHSKNFLIRLWWRLTQPIGVYLALNDILNLQRFSHSFANETPSVSVDVYYDSPLNKQLSWWDKLFSTWRYELHCLVGQFKNDVSTEKTTFQADKTDNDLYGKELDFLYNEFTTSIDKLLSQLEHKYFYDLEGAIDILKIEQKKCLQVLLKMHPDKNSSCLFKSTEYTKLINITRSQILERLEIMTNPNYSLFKIATALQNLEFITPKEYNSLKNLKIFIIDQRYNDLIKSYRTQNTIINNLREEIRKNDEYNKQRLHDLEKKVADFLKRRTDTAKNSSDDSQSLTLQSPRFGKGY